MFEKIQFAEDRFEEISQKLMDPAVVGDNEQYKALMKEYKSLTPIVDKYREYKTVQASVEEARSLLEEGGEDRDFLDMAEEELQSGRRRLEELSTELKTLLLPKDPNDERSVVMEIRGGAGGEEAALFAGTLLRMYSMYAETKSWRVEITNANETELGGFKEVGFLVEGEGAYSKLKYESGVHRVQRVPETESQGRIHTSTVTVAVLPEAEDVEIEINPGDLQIDTYRASGAGGQHVNKTESAIRITHLPTGLVIECQDERSQHKNREKAMRVLRARLYEAKLQEQNDAISSERKSQVGTGDRSERIRTYNYPQGRVTDHRIGLTLYRLESFLNGDIEEVVDALATAEQAEKLRAAADEE